MSTWFSAIQQQRHKQIRNVFHKFTYFKCPCEFAGKFEVSELVKYVAHLSGFHLAQLDQQLQRDRHPNLLLDRARLYLRINKHKEALRDIDSAIKTSASEGYFLRGKCFMAIGRHQDAVQDFSRLISKQRGTANVFANRARAFMGLQNHEQAKEDLKEALRLDPTNKLADKLLREYFQHVQAEQAVRRQSVD